MYATFVGDNVAFCEENQFPGVPIVVKVPEDRAANPERVNLDKRHLKVCLVGWLIAFLPWLLAWFSFSSIF